MIFRIADIIRKVFRNSETKQSQGEERREELNNAVDLIGRAISRHSVAICQGPPGTGKTEVLKRAIMQNLDKFDKNEVVLYIVPTNALAAHVFERLVADMREQEYSEKDVISMIRIYGSQFDYRGFEELRGPVNSNVKVIITTEYQRIYGSHNIICHIMIDEASRSLIHKPFIPLAHSLEAVIEGKAELYGSVSVVGDPMQAILLGTEHRRRRTERLLIEVFIASLLKHYCGRRPHDTFELIDLAHRYLRDKCYAFLDITYRLPEPTEKPISFGYYGGRLKSKYSADERLRGIENLIQKTTSTALEGILHNAIGRKVIDLVKEALTSHIPLIIVESKGSGYWDYEVKYGILYDPLRAKLGIMFAIAFAYFTHTDVCVITPYCDQTQQMKLICERKYGGFLRSQGIADKVKFMTVQKMLGSEADIVIAVLGKEYFGSEDAPTVYFQEPELLNVQLSRHKRILVVIGDLRGLYKQVNRVHKKKRERKYWCIKETIKVMFEDLAGFSKRDIMGKLPANRKVKGDKVIFWKVQ